MTYQVAWTGPARRDMRRLPLRIAEVVLTYVDERLSRQPQRLSKPLQGGLEGLRSARSGDYRVLFSLDEDHQHIVIYRVDHRAHVYRPR